MAFEIKPDTPQRELPDGIVIVSGPGGTPWVTDPKQPHLGGNIDGGDKGSMYQDDLWPWLLKTFELETMADIGCGTGEAMRWFQETGGISVLGVEGLEWNANKCPSPTLVHDLNNGPCHFKPVDMIWCSDMAEHIEERFVHNLLDTLTQCSVLAMCQGTEIDPHGWHHVNNQPQEYWVDKLAKYGMIEDKEATEEARKVGNHGWWELSGRIYRKMENTQ